MVLVDVVASVVRACEVLVSRGSHYQPDSSQIYSGYYSISKILGDNAGTWDTLLPGLVDQWKCARALQKRPVSSGEFETLFCYEFATNLVISDGKISLVSQKSLALPFGNECVLNWGSDSPEVDADILDFIWNVLYLKLKTSKDIVSFVKQCDTGGDAELLTPEEVQTLLLSGKHEIFSEESLSDTKEALSEMKCMILHTPLSPPPPLLDFPDTDLIF